MEKVIEGRGFSNDPANTLTSYLRGEFRKRGWRWPKHPYAWKQYFIYHHAKTLSGKNGHHAREWHNPLPSFSSSLTKHYNSLSAWVFECYSRYSAHAPFYPRGRITTPHAVPLCERFPNSRHHRRRNVAGDRSCNACESALEELFALLMGEHGVRRCGDVFVAV